MKKPKFSKPPMPDTEKEKRAEAFINLSDAPYNSKKKLESTNGSTEIRRAKEKTKALFLRVPESLFNDIEEIMILTGLTKNAICLQLLRPAVKDKLKELKEQ